MMLFASFCRRCSSIEFLRVSINFLQNDPLARFGEIKQSVIGREYGLLGLGSYIEPKTLIGA
jgi:aldehyde dehydrogenase (NAD+)